jgi:hypothetical protein
LSYQRLANVPQFWCQGGDRSPERIGTDPAIPLLGNFPRQVRCCVASRQLVRVSGQNGYRGKRQYRRDDAEHFQLSHINAETEMNWSRFSYLGSRIVYISKSVAAPLSAPTGPRLVLIFRLENLIHHTWDMLRPAHASNGIQAQQHAFQGSRSALVLLLFAPRDRAQSQDTSRRPIFMSLTGSDIEFTPKAKRLEDGIVKFPPNIHSIRINHSDETGHTTLNARQNNVTLTFVLNEEDCLYLAALLTGAPSLSESDG